MLGVNGATGSKGRVELYEKGYGKDAAGIAKEAISYGASRVIFCIPAPSGINASDFTSGSTRQRF